MAQPNQPGSRILFQLLGGIRYVTIEHNSGLTSDKFVLFDGGPTSGLMIRNNVTSRGQYGVFGSGWGEGTAALRYYAPDGSFAGNVVVGAPGTMYPSQNFYPPDLQTAGLLGDLSLSSPTAYLSGTTDSSAPGANVTEVLSSTSDLR